MAIALVGVLSAFPRPCHAQSGGPFAVYADLMRDRVTIYRGDATIGPVSTRGWTLAAGIRDPRGHGGELWLASASRGRSAPDLGMLGAMGVVSFSRWLPADVLGVFSGGIVGIRVREWPDFSCVVEECLFEGGPSFENGTGVALALGIGATFSLSWLRARVDYRVITPSGVTGQAITRLGLGVGVAW